MWSKKDVVELLMITVCDIWKQLAKRTILLPIKDTQVIACHVILLLRFISFETPLQWYQFRTIFPKIYFGNGSEPTLYLILQEAGILMISWDKIAPLENFSVDI